jgi:gas vesicle protein
MNEEKNSPTDNSGSDTSSLGAAPQLAKQVTQTAQTQIDTLKHSALEQGSAAVEEIKTAAQSAARQVQEAGRDFVHEQKQNLAHKVDEYAGAVRATAERLRDDEGNVLATPAQKAAEQLEQMSSYLREKEPADFLDDLESFARRKPEVVFGALFAVGLAAARFFKASRRRPRRAELREPVGDAPSPAFPPTSSFSPQPASTSLTP